MFENGVKTNNLRKNQSVIAVWGTNGAGKSTIAAALSVMLSQNYGFKTLCADFNTVSPVLDHYFGIDKNITEKKGNLIGRQKYNNTSLGLIFDAIERNVFEDNSIINMSIPYSDNNLRVLTGNYLLDLFEAFNTNHFDIIIEAAKKNFDSVILDLNSLALIDATYSALVNSNIILAVCEADYTSLREINRNIEYLSKLVPKKKFKIIVNKYTDKNLEQDIVEEILDGLELIGTISYNTGYIKAKVDKKPYILQCSEKEKRQYMNLIGKIV